LILFFATELCILWRFFPNNYCCVFLLDVGIFLVSDTGLNLESNLKQSEKNRVERQQIVFCIQFEYLIQMIGFAIHPHCRGRDEHKHRHKTFTEIECLRVRACTHPCTRWRP